MGGLARGSMDILRPGSLHPRPETRFVFCAGESGPPCAVGEGRNARHNGRIRWTVRTLESASRTLGWQLFRGGECQRPL